MDKITILINYETQEIFLSKCIDVSNYEYDVDCFDLVLGTAKDLFKILKHIEHDIDTYDIKVLTISELKKLLKTYGFVYKKVI